MFEDSTLLYVHHIITGGRIIRRDDDIHFPLRFLKKIVGEVYVKMALIKKSATDEKLYSITKYRKIIKQSFNDDEDPEHRIIKSFNG